MNQNLSNPLPENTESNSSGWKLKPTVFPKVYNPPTADSTINNIEQLESGSTPDLPKLKWENEFIKTIPDRNWEMIKKKMDLDREQIEEIQEKETIKKIVNVAIGTGYAVTGTVTLPPTGTGTGLFASDPCNSIRIEPIDGWKPSTYYHVEVIFGKEMFPNKVQGAILYTGIIDSITDEPGKGSFFLMNGQGVIDIMNNYSFIEATYIRALIELTNNNEIANVPNIGKKWDKMKKDYEALFQ